MAHVPEKVVGGTGLAALTASLALFCSLAAGCASMGSSLSSSDAAPTGAVCQAVACWDNHVMYAPDPVHNGMPTPGLAGRMYLFGPEIGTSLIGDGGVVVDLYDETHPAAGPNPPPLEEWRIDKDTLKRLQRRDPIGAGYTLFLPWGTYRPDINRVRLQLSYHPVNGTPLYAPTSSVTLSSDADTTGSEMAGRPAIRSTSQAIGASGRIVSN